MTKSEFYWDGDAVGYVMRSIRIAWTGPGAISWNSYDRQYRDESDIDFCRRIEDEYDAHYPESSPHYVTLRD